MAEEGKPVGSVRSNGDDYGEALTESDVGNSVCGRSRESAGASEDGRDGVQDKTASDSIAGECRGCEGQGEAAGGVGSREGGGGDLVKEGALGGRPECYVVVHSVAKRHNIGMLLRSSSAFDVKQVVVVGRRDLNTFGSHGAAGHVDLKHCYSLKDAQKYLKEEKGCNILGVEITCDAVPIHSHPFKGSTAFLLGNEGTGLSDAELAVCDACVYIPQYGAGTASLNVVVAASIVLHHFAVWAGYQEQSHSHGKFQVAMPPVRRMPRNRCADGSPEEVAEKRREWAAKVEEMQEEGVGGCVMLEDLQTE